ncbi:MAG: PQQ-dependent sugar dehydrogenase [Cytophagaceae bacterium]|nr:PQQ-dependent sugar dehydrogenase [Gemmatimonadaceae bacterium]
MQAAAPPGASVGVTVQVLPAMATPPFDVARTLFVPPGFTVEVAARVPNARFLLQLPKKEFLVSSPNNGTITLVRPRTNNTPLTYTFASGLRKPHDMVLATINGTRYLYVAESHQVSRAVYGPGDNAMRARTVVVANLPDAGGHPLKNIAIDPSGKLYVSIASSCNACASDATSNPVRGAIYRYNANGTGGVLFARGLRNAEGLAFLPNTSTLWVVVNNRDQIPYPVNDVSGNYGRVFSGFVDDHPPEEFTSVVQGGNYGWPFCNPNPTTANGMDDMPFDVDYDNRGAGMNCATMTRISKGIQAHSAPLGMLFLQPTAFPTAYRAGVAIALHGSWNRTVRTGYKVIHFSWDALAQRPTTQIDLVTGWLTTGGTVWGRPVDVAMAGDGGLLISDDQSGTVYKLRGPSGG